jgi:hypothetical protein
LPCSPRSPVHRVWLPSRRRKQPQSPGKPLSASDARGLNPSESCSSSVIEKKVSRLSFRSGSFRPNHPGLVPELQRLGPPKKRCPLLFPWVFTPGRGPYSLGRYDLSGIPVQNVRGKVSLSSSPLSFFPPDNLTIARKRNPRGFRHFGLGVSLRRGRRPGWPFSPTILRYLFGTPPAAGYFFASGTRRLLRDISMPS